MNTKLKTCLVHDRNQLNYIKATKPINLDFFLHDLCNTKRRNFFEILSKVGMPRALKAGVINSY